MKWICFLYLALSWTSFAQKLGDDAIIYSENEGTKRADIRYKNQRRSLIEWDKLKEDEWLSLDLWKRSIAQKARHPEWEFEFRDRFLQEMVGKVIGCVGECRVYRGLGYSRSSYLSRIREGDEVVTEDGSYVWIFLMDGTLVRLSPNSSITFKEINIGTDQVFFHARINKGNILWLTRPQYKIIEQETRETDTIFFPLEMSEANRKEIEININEDNLFNMIDHDNGMASKYTRVNKLIEKNNRFANKKKSNYFLVLPNGNVYGSEFQAEFVVLTGAESYMKLRSYQFQRYKTKEKPSPATFFYRGFENKDTINLELDQWYTITPRGRKITKFDNSINFYPGEFLTLNIPTILTARELMIDRYSEFLYEADLGRKEVGLKYGYRLWNSKRDNELEDRLLFLKEFTRRMETTNLLVASQFKKKMSRNGKVFESAIYSRKYYRKALQNYFSYREDKSRVFQGGGVLNSTRRPFWKKINEK